MKVAVKRWALPLMAAVTLFAAGCAKQESATVAEAESQPSNSNLVIGYAQEGVTVVEDPQEMEKSLQRAMENAEKSMMALEYKNEAFSVNGVNFDCYIANSMDNKYDMFIQIFADETLQDELFLSQLLRPGQAFEKLTLNHSLPTGMTRVYVAMTQVETVGDQQSICGQTFVTMDFMVA